MRILSLLVLLLAAPAAEAGLKFDFSIVSMDDSLNPGRSGTVLVDGLSYLIHFDEGGVVFSALVSEDGGESEIAINHDLRTYYEPAELHGLERESRLFMMPALNVESPKIKLLELHEEEGSSPIENLPARKWVIQLLYEMQYSVGKESIRGVCDTTAIIWTTDALEAPFVPLDPRCILTGWSSIDHRLEQELSVIEGFPLKRDMTVTRRIVGGAPFTDMITTTFTNFEPAEPATESFAIPEGYTYQEPTYGMGSSSVLDALPASAR